MPCLLSLVVGSFVFVCYVLVVRFSIWFLAVGSQLLLQITYEKILLFWTYLRSLVFVDCLLFPLS